MTDAHTRPTRRPAQTIKQAKAEYAKHGPRLSSQEARRLERGAELYRRAEKIKESEKKRKAALKRRQEKEHKEREARKRRGGAVVPAARVVASQVSMSCFVRVEKIGSVKEQRAVKNVECCMEEPWDQEELEDAELLDLVAPAEAAALSPRVEELVRCDASRPSQEQDKANASNPTPDANDLKDAWDEFLLSNSQIERDLSSPATASPRWQRSKPEPEPEPENLLESISTQDVKLSDEDLQELGIAESTCSSNTSPSEPSGPVAEQSRPAADIANAESEEQRDRRLMPPPPRRERRTVATVSRTVATQSHRQQAAALCNLAPPDFELLSTQDCFG